MLDPSHRERAAGGARRQLAGTRERAPAQEGAARAGGREQPVDERDLGRDLLGLALHQRVGQGDGPALRPRARPRRDQPGGRHADERVEHRRARRQRARTRPACASAIGASRDGPSGSAWASHHAATSIGWRRPAKPSRAW
jgi:hypothetical protein